MRWELVAIAVLVLVVWAALGAATISALVDLVVTR